MYTTSGSHVKSNRADTSMSANDHQETGRGICLYALNDGATTILVRTVDTDVVVILVGINAVMGRLWHRKALSLLPHQLNLLRISGGKSSCFALVHPFSGSGTTSLFSGKGKKSAWKA